MVKNSGFKNMQLKFTITLNWFFKTLQMFCSGALIKNFGEIGTLVGKQAFFPGNLIPEIVIWLILKI